MDAQTQDETGESNVHPDRLVNENPLSGPFYTVIEFIQSYGWIILFGLVVCLYIKSKLSPTVRKYKQKIEDTIESKKFDSSKAQSRLEAMDAARQRMQAQLDAQAARHAEQMKQKEEEKRKQKIEDWEGHTQGKGYRSKYKPKEEQSTSASSLKTDKKKPLRSSDYNPLTGGDGGSCAWRPGQRRGGAGGG
ncbi:selenoprotein S-like [Ruditapes philippinarum]|uniref:selenoprotein S-like n=1 Tax=Ruditapes philippinarum TaxID=129788 RepID=UPI00295C1BCE|nr:selenoprotein S-like [Ruditapes philippinarum]